MNFTLEPRDGWTKLSPMSGTTPQEITLTFDPAPFIVGNRINGAVTFTSDGAAAGSFILNYTIITKTVNASPDRSDREAAPGSLLSYTAGTSRCDSSPAQSPPWPTRLGGCALRLNGVALPIGAITQGQLSSSGVLFE